MPRLKSDIKDVKYNYHVNCLIGKKALFTKFSWGANESSHVTAH